MLQLRYHADLSPTAIAAELGADAAKLTFLLQSIDTRQLFDIEVVFLYPWAIIYKDYLAAFGPSILAVATGFVSILLVAFVYAWKKGVLDWKS